MLVSAWVDSVDVAELQALLMAQRPTQRFIDTAERDAAQLVRRVVVLALVAGILGGGVAGALVWHRSWRRIAGGALAGAVTVGALFGATWSDWPSSSTWTPCSTRAT